MIDSFPSKFKYSLHTVYVSIYLITCSLLSLRSVKKTLPLIKYCNSDSLPSHTTIQNWFLRYGLYELSKKAKKRDDWIFILDHSIEFGKKQCLLVLGVTLESFRKNNCKLKHDNVQVMGVDIVESATGQSVSDCLNEIIKYSGYPVQIVSDGGSNIINGAVKVLGDKIAKKTAFQTYDITHKMAIFLKKIILADEDWTTFNKEMVECKRSLIHTCLGYLSPPKPKDKARWLNFDSVVYWSEAVFALDTDAFDKEEAKKFDEKLEWIKKHKHLINKWSQIIEMLITAKNEVKSNGLSFSTVENFQRRIKHMKIDNDTLLKLKSDIIKYLEIQCDGMNAVYCGCSDIIESVFGKYKVFSSKSPMREIGKSILAIPAFLGTLDKSEVLKAMESVSQKDLEKWINRNIGQSFLSKRKKLFEFKNKKSGEGKIKKCA